ncbi:HlyD family secretion protein [Lichenihabitans sp. Uapishka_5]|uniref:HlyD family secretion protein n=1 Tax=Lichenihabitans sp. Uapishka_5 TaxID=3037302 RepID=UPI0029E7F236|nr:HlyD family secretion protein [Lichenihabitans sp. Uapishka_5]MDX7952021.1 HlyD family secretion protein [Lichenihabitans sp. Uapishka_5]
MANNADGDDDRGTRGRSGRRDVLDIGQGGSRRDGRGRDRDDEDDDRPRRDDRRDRDRDDEPRARRNDDDRRSSRDDDRRSRKEPTDDRDENTDRDANKGDKGGKDAKADQSEKAGKTDTGKQDEDAKSQEQRKKRRPTVLIIVAVVALLAIAGGLYYYLSNRGKVETDDAYTDGNVVSIAPQVSGEVVSLDVNDNQFVHKGDPLIHIDPRQYQFTLEQQQGSLDTTNAQVVNQKLGVEIAKKNFPAGLQLAKANLESAQATLALQKQNYDRQKSLPKQATTQQEVDTATSNQQAAQAQVDQAEARVTQAEPVQQNIAQSQQQVSQLQGQIEQAKGRVDQANLNIEWTVLRAPQDGWVTRRNVNKGNYVSAGTQIMSLVTTDLWVTANFKETELDGMRAGQQVAISIDAYPDLTLRGHVDSIQRGSGSKFSAFPAENATGNFIKIVQRVPVKIVIDSGTKPDEPLPLGISVVPSVMLK